MDPYGVWGAYGAGGVCRPSLTSHPNAQPYREIPMGSGVIMGPEGLQTHPEPTPPSLTPRPKARPYGEIPMGSGVLMGLEGCADPASPSAPNCSPIGSFAVGFGVIMGPEGLRTQPHLSPQCMAL